MSGRATRGSVRRKRPAAAAGQTQPGAPPEDPSPTDDPLGSDEAAPEPKRKRKQVEHFKPAEFPRRKTRAEMAANNRAWRGEALAGARQQLSRFPRRELKATVKGEDVVAYAWELPGLAHEQRRLVSDALAHIRPADGDPAWQHKQHRHYNLQALLRTNHGRVAVAAMASYLKNEGWNDSPYRGVDGQAVCRGGGRASGPLTVARRTITGGGITSAAHQDARTGSFAYATEALAEDVPGGVRLLLPMGSNRPLRIYAVEGTTARLLASFDDGVLLTGLAAGAGREGPFYHERADEGDSLSIDLAMPAKKKGRGAGEQQSSKYAYNVLNGYQQMAADPKDPAAKGSRWGAGAGRRGGATLRRAQEVASKLQGAAPDEEHCFWCGTDNAGRGGRWEWHGNWRCCRTCSTSMYKQVPGFSPNDERPGAIVCLQGCEYCQR